VKLPGCRRQRELRGWTIGELARRAGVTYKAAMNADRGDKVSGRTAQALARAFAGNPPPEGMVELLEAQG